jgi:hypothetical protein
MPGQTLSILITNIEIMKMNNHPKSHRYPTPACQAGSCNSRPRVTNPGCLPARRIMICLGWLRLYETILSNKSGTRHDKAFAH